MGEGAEIQSSQLSSLTVAGRGGRKEEERELLRD